MYQQDKKAFSFFLQFADLEDPLDLTFLPSNPNFDAKIGFICDDPDDFWTMAPLLKELEKEAEFVFVIPSLLPTKVEEKEINLLLNLLAKLASKKELPWRLFPPRYIKNVDRKLERALVSQESATLIDFLNKYDLLIGSNPLGMIASPLLSHKKKILLWDDATLNCYPERLSYFDAALTIGTYSATMLSPFVKTFSVGSPRLEEAETNLVDSSIKESGNKKNKPILYLPAADNVDIKENIGALVEALPKGFQIRILIPYFRLHAQHLWTQHHSTPEVALFFKGEIDRSLLIGHSDIILLENLHYLHDCIFFEKPLILSDFIFEGTDVFNPYEELMPRADTKSFGENDPTVADIGLILKRPWDLADAIKKIENEELHKKMLNAQQNIKSILFSRPQDGSAFEAAKLIKKEQNLPRSPESLISRAYALGKNLALQRMRLEERFGIKPPYSPLTEKILKLLLRSSQQLR